MLLLFFIVWLIFNQAITLEIVLFGIGISLMMFVFVCKFMDHSMHQELLLYRRAVFLIRYFVILVREIIKANLAVIRLIVSNTEVIEPYAASFRTNLKSEFARVLLANSITLTPGTMTVILDGDFYVVHCLDRSLAEGMEDSIFVHMLEQLEEMGE